MEVVFTNHAAQRMMQRGINIEHVHEALFQPDTVIIDGQVRKAYKQQENNTLVVVFTINKTIKVITTYYQ